RRLPKVPSVALCPMCSSSSAAMPNASQGGGLRLRGGYSARSRGHDRTVGQDDLHSKAGQQPRAEIVELQSVVRWVGNDESCNRLEFNASRVGDKLPDGQLGERGLSEPKAVPDRHSHLTSRRIAPGEGPSTAGRPTLLERGKLKIH